MQTDISQAEGKQIMPGTQLTSFQALSVYPRIEISLSASQTDDRFYLSHPGPDKIACIQCIGCIGAHVLCH